MTLSASLRAVLPQVAAQWAIPPRLVLGRQMLYRTAGNPIAPAGIAEPKARSPLHSTGKITDALMVPQGASDRRVPQGESKQMIKMPLSRGIPVAYLLLPNEGHGFSREPNRLVFDAMLEAFVAHHFGGDLEPFEIEDFEGHGTQFRRGDLPHGQH